MTAVAGDLAKVVVVVAAAWPIPNPVDFLLSESWATIEPDPAGPQGRLAISAHDHASSSAETSRLRVRGRSGRRSKCCDMIETDEPENGKVPVADS